MKTTSRFYVLLATLLLTFVGFSQRAKNGDYTTTGAAEILNTYTRITVSPAVGATSITVANNSMVGGAFATPLEPGDKILIIQMYMERFVQPIVSWEEAVDISFYPWNEWNLGNGWGPYTVPASYFSPGPYGANPENFGRVKYYGYTGWYETAEVTSVAGATTINLQCGLKNPYLQSRVVQVIRIPRYNNLNVAAGTSIVPQTWNGSTGGIVALEVDANLDIASGARVSASSAGFRGGQLDPTGTSGNPLIDFENRYLGTDQPGEGSEKGESIYGYHTEYDVLHSRYGKGAIANGGGGGGYQNCGGGGGSNVQIGAPAYNGLGNPIGYPAIWALEPIVTGSSGGGRGGYALSQNDADETIDGPNNFAWGGDNRKDNGGWGGHPLTYDPDRLFFGGGGGAGDQDSDDGGAGGAGGGIVFITNYGTITGDGIIEANGEAGENSNPDNTPLGVNAHVGNDGAGGGGAGGSIYIENAAAIPATISLNAIGGDGGDQDLQVNVLQTPEAGGPGGSGSGGAIAIATGTGTQDVSAGLNGTTNSSHMVDFPPNGATEGSAGESDLAATYYDLIAPDVAVCSGQPVTQTVSVLGTLPSGTTVANITWYSQQFCHPATNIVQTGVNYPSPLVTTTYYVAICPGSFRVPVTITITASPTLIITDPASICSPATADITAAAVTAGSDPGPLSYWDDAGATIVQGTPATVGPGTYYILLDLGGGCTAIEPVVVTASPVEDPTFTMTPTCEGGTANLTGTPGGTFSFNVPPGDAAVIDGVSGAVTNGTLGSTYDILYTTPGPCVATLVVSVTAASDLAYTATLTNENCGAGDGIVDLSASGGDGGPYQYSITGGVPYSGSGNFTGLSAATYNISILDNSGCEVTGSESISSSGAPTIDNITPSSPTCAGGCDGSITVSVSGGTPPYTYQWYDNLSNPIGPDNATITGLCAGDYSVEVTDASGGTVVFFTEDYGTGCSQGNLANGTITTNGTWTTTLTGFNGGGANDWFVSATESGMGAGNCGDGCLATGPDNRTLHVANTAIGTGACFFCPTGDCGAAYADGTTDLGLCPGSMDPTMNARAESPTIDCSGQSSITVDFEYIAGGQPGVDFCTVEYFDGATWSALVVPAVTATCGAQGLWTASSVALPASADNNPNVRIGFRWQQVVDDGGTDPSFAVDNVTLSTSSSACPAIANTTIVDPPAPNLTITDPAAVCATGTVDLTLPAVTAGSDAGTLTYWTDAGATIALGTPNAVSVSNTYYIQLDVAGCTVIEPVVVTINPQPNLVITDPAAVCSPGTVDISALAVTAGSDAGTLTYWADLGATIPVPAPNAVPISGTAYIQLVDANTCSSIAAVNVTVNAVPNLVITDPSAVCAPGTVDLTAAGVTAGSDAGTLTYWDDAGATIVQATPGAVGTGTYYIQLEDANTCTSIQAVNATVTAAPNLVITDPAAVCTPGTADLTLAAVTAGSDVGTLTYWTDAGATIALGMPTSVGNGTYYIQLDIGGGCTVVQPVNVVVNALPNLVITDPAGVCTPGTVDLTGAAVTAGSDAGTLTYWDDAGATIVQATPASVGNGTYYIQLEDANLCTSIQAVNATVNALPNLVVTDPGAVCAPGTVDLTAAGVTAGSDAGTLTYWDDAGATIVQATPGAVGTGTYYIQLEDANTCTSIQAVNATVTAAPNLVITDPAAVCTPGTADLTLAAVTAGSDVGTLTYWTDAGATIALGTPTSVGNGTYYIQLDIGGGCTVVQPVNVVVNALPNLVITDPAGVCTPGTVDLTGAAVTAGSDAGTLTYWDDAGATIVQATPASVGNGTYYIQLEDANLCTSIQAVNATVNALPNLVVTDPGAVCAPGTVDLTAAGVTAGSDAGTLTYWDDAGATIVQATPGAVGTGTYYIQLEDANTCTSIQAVTATVTAAPNLVITDPAAVCTPGNVDLTLAAVTAGSDVGTLTYWTDAGATIALGTPTSVGNGTYYIQLDIGGGCTVVQPVNVVVNALPNLVITDPAGVCTPGTVDLTGAAVTAGSDAGTLTYWDDAGATIVQATPASVGNGTYYIQLEDANLCTSIQAVNATVNALPNLVVTDPGAVCAPGTVDLTAAGVTAGSDAGTLTYWDDAGATIVQATPGAVGTGTYYIQLEDANTCTSIQAVTATVTAAPNLVITDPAAVCTPGNVDLTLAAVTAGSDVGTLTYWTDAGATIALGTPTSVGNGTYYIQLDIGGGCTVVQPVNVVVNALPNLVITDPAGVCTPGTVDLTGAAVTAGSDAGTLTYWDDAGATIFQATPASVGNGTYYIQLEDANLCTSIQAVNATVNALPNLVVTDPGAVCAPGTVDLTAAGVTAGSDAGTLTYWDDAGATIVQATPGAVGTGTYYIQLEDANTCTSTLAVNAVVNPTPTLVITDPAAVCSPASVDISAAAVTAGSGAGTLTYWDDAGATIAQATPGALTTSGVYYIQLEDANTCTTTLPVNVTVNAAPVLVITDPAAVCLPGTVDITVPAITAGSGAGTLTYWDDAAATIVQATPSTLGTSGTYYIQLEDANLCTAIAPVVVTVTANPNLVITDPAGVCSPGTIDLTLPAVTAGSDIGTLSYWTDATATTSLGTPTTVGTAGIYYIQLDLGGGCSVIEPVNVTINPLPNLIITDPAAVCEPNSVDLTSAGVTGGSDAGTLTYWIDAAGTSVLATPNAVSASGVYYIQLEDANTCTSIVAVNTIVNALDDASFLLTGTCDGGTALVSGLSGGTFSFDTPPTDGAVIDVTTGTISGGGNSTSYSINYLTNGICPNSSVQSVVSSDCNVIDLIIPTAFTPSPSDGVNDTWEILGLDVQYPNNIVRIYNRWGGLIFEHESSPSDPYSANQWDGTNQANGQKMPVASYYYIIDFNDDTKESEKGTVSIIEMK